MPVVAKAGDVAARDGCDVELTACRVDGGVVMKGPRRRKLYHDRGIFTAQPEAIEKTARSWRVLRGRSAYAHEPEKQTRRKPQNRNQTLKNRQP